MNIRQTRTQYAQRVRDAKSNHKMDDKQRAFRIKSATQNAYMRIVMAYDDKLRVTSLQDHRRKFRKMPRGE